MAADRGLISLQGNTNRNQSYHLTPSGRDALISLLLAYSAEIIQLYGAAKKEVSEQLTTLQAENIRSIALFGAAETAEVVYAALKDTPLKVKAVVDSDPAKQGKRFNGLPISHPDALKSLDVDAVVITSYARQKEIHDCIGRIAGEDVRIKKRSDL